MGNNPDASPFGAAVGAAIAVSGNQLLLANPDAPGYIPDPADPNNVLFAPLGEVYVFDVNDGSYLATIKNPTPQYSIPDDGSQFDDFGVRVAALSSGKFIITNAFDDVLSGGGDDSVIVVSARSPQRSLIRCAPTAGWHSAATRQTPRSES